MEIISTLLAVFLAYLYGLRRSRRERIEQLFTDAFSSVAAQQAARHVPQQIASEIAPDLDESDLTSVKRQLQRNAIDRFVESTLETRAALGAVYPYAPEVRPYWEKFEVAPEELDEVLTILTDGMRKLNTLRFKRHKP